MESLVESRMVPMDGAEFASLGGDGEFLSSLYQSAFDVEVPHRGLREHKKGLAHFAQRALVDWSPPMRSGFAEERPFQVIDFFSGCGGMSAGFAAASTAFPFFEMIGGCDINGDAAKAYAGNFNAVGMKRDIVGLAGDDAALGEFMAGLDRYDPDKPLIVIGCAPCQGFSAHRKHNWDNDDERNTLVGAFAALAVKLAPECVIMENVPEMLSGKYWKHFAEARDVFTDAGYTVHQAVYNTASFGVPQERFRSLMIAMNHDFLMPEPMYEHDEFMTVKDAIGHLPAIEAGERHPEDFLHRCAGHRESTLETIRAVPKDGGSRPFGVGPKCLDRVKGYYDVYGRLHWNRPAITITHYARNPASGRYVHPEQDRGLSVREAALLQSFPEGYYFSGTFDEMFKQIGEAVPPKFSCAIAASVLVELLSPEPEDHERERAFRSISEPVKDSFSGVIAGIKSSRRKAAE